MLYDTNLGGLFAQGICDADIHTVDFYEHVYLGLKPRYISDTPMTIKSHVYIWFEWKDAQFHSVTFIYHLNPSY